MHNVYFVKVNLYNVHNRVINLLSVMSSFGKNTQDDLERTSIAIIIVEFRLRRLRTVVLPRGRGIPVRSVLNHLSNFEIRYRVQERIPIACGKIRIFPTPRATVDRNIELNKETA